MLTGSAYHPSGHTVPNSHICTKANCGNTVRLALRGKEGRKCGIHLLKVKREIKKKKVKPNDLREQWKKLRLQF